jgi:hypothetical protein
MYLLIDPPVTAFSPPEEIAQWIGELEELARKPEYAARGTRALLRSALKQARQWLDGRAGTENPRPGGAPVPASRRPS